MQQIHYLRAVARFGQATITTRAPDTTGTLGRSGVPEMSAQTLQVKHQLSIFQRALRETLPEESGDATLKTTAIAALLKLAPLVFVQPDDLRQARWADVDLDAGEWRFSTSKTGKTHIVPLAVQAVDILRGLQPLTGHGEFVFPSARNPECPMSDVEMKLNLQRMGFDDTSIYDFRKMARTVLGEKAFGIPLDCIKLQLGRPVVLDMSERVYSPEKCDPTYRLDERKVMMQTWADWLDSLCGGENAEVMVA